MSVSTQPSSQNGNIGGTASFTVLVNGTPPFSYFWYKNGAFLTSTTNTSSISNTYTTPTITAGNNGDCYYVLITNCNSTQQVQSNTACLTVCSAPSQPGTIAGPSNVCAGISQTYSISPVSGATSYSWSFSGSGTPSGSGTSVNLTPGSSGTLSVTANNNCGSSIASTLTITVDPIPAQPGTIAGPQNVCAGTTQTYSIAPVSGATGYTWSHSGGGTYGGGGTSITLAPGSSGTLSVTANNSCGSSIARTLTITVDPLPAQPGTIAGSSNVCAGISQTYSISPVSGATSYTWSYSGSGAPSGSGTSINLTPGSSGTLSVTANNNCGSSAPALLSVNVSPTPTQPGTIAGSNSVCQGSSQTYSVSAVAGATSYTWNLPAGWSGTSTSTSISTTTGSTGGAIFVTANNACGASSPSVLNVNVSPTPTQPGAIAGSNSVCQGSAQAYSISAVAGATSYTWNLPAGWSGTSTSTSISTTAGSTGGAILVSANNACGASSPSVLNVNVSPTPTQPGAITGSSSVCQGSSQAYSISAVAGATSYTWNLPSGWSGASTSTSINATVGSAGGAILVSANNACGASSPSVLNVNVSPTPTQPGAITGSSSVCQGSSQAYSISAVAGATSYTWNLPSGWSGASTSTSINATVGSTGGAILVSANNACGASSPSVLNVNVSPTPTQPGAIAGSNSVCQGSSQTYSVSAVSGATSYTWNLPAGWSGASTSTSINATVGSAGGTIFVSANNACGASTPRTLTVTVSPTPTQPGAIAGSNSVCQGSSQTYSVSAVSGATSYTWNLPAGWSGTSTSTSISATAGSTGGAIFVTANNACGASSPSVLNVNVSPTPTQPGTIAGSNSVCQGSPQTYSISAVAGATSYTWNLPSGWSGTSTSTSISTTAGSSGGTIFITANNACGASSPSVLNVNVSPTPTQPGAIAGSNSVCQGSSQTYSISAVAGATSYTWNLPSGWSGTSTSTSISTTASSSGGAIFVTANNACGASSPSVLNVNVSPTLTQPGAIAGSNSVCQGSSQTYSISAVAGATSYNWNLPAGWSGTSTSTSINATVGSAGGAIFVTANNACGASSPSVL
ncbi:MAG TPA: hypothetical protein PLZ12_04080, partial [Saprospiraceae bacterium]|nr:hypothetical protein [Saprospiraceae bacterium]